MTDAEHAARLALADPQSRDGVYTVHIEHLRVALELLDAARREQTTLSDTAARLVDLLAWYVENDDTREGGKWEESNALWLRKKREAEALIAAMQGGANSG